MAVLNRFKSNWKIKLHTDWIEKYLKHRSYPICLEIDPANLCPLNCRYCCWSEFRNNNLEIIDQKTLNRLVRQAKKLGVKSIIWTGGGDPLANPATISAIELSKSLGLNNGLFTNGALLSKEWSQRLVNVLDWVRFHVAGSTPEFYHAIHRVPKLVFNQVYDNIKYFSSVNKGKVSTGIGVAINPLNFNSAKRLPYLSVDLGLEYFQGKLDFYELKKRYYTSWWEKKVVPYFQGVEKALEGKLRLHIFSDPVVRKTEVNYCHAHHIITAITADGDVSFCKMRRGQKETVIGNVYEHTLKEIFDGQAHKRICDLIRPKECKILASFCPYRTTNEVVDEVVQLDKSMGACHRNFF